MQDGVKSLNSAKIARQGDMETFKTIKGFPYGWFFEYQITLSGTTTHYKRILRLEKYVDKLCSFLTRFRGPIEIPE